METLFGKNVIVTGCTGGVGSPVCKLMKTNGANVIGISRNINNLSDENKKFLDDYICHDLTSHLPVEIINKILCEFKSVDFLIHCTGSLITGELNDLTEDEITSVINSNLLSTIFSVKAFLPVMKKQGSGHIIIVGSLGGIIPMPYEALYSSVKFGVRGLCLSLAEELKEYGIKISLISPGSIKTKMLDKEAEDDDSIISFMIKPMQPEKIANEILKVIHKPKIEVIIPKVESLLSMVFASNPGLFLKCFTWMKKLGAGRLNSYRKKYMKYFDEELRWKPN